MRDLRLQAAGVLAILVAIAHSAIGELRVFAKAHRAAMDAEPAAGGVASQHHRLDRHWALADRRAPQRCPTSARRAEGEIRLWAVRAEGATRRFMHSQMLKGA
jgi:hypothetical protein